MRRRAVFLVVVATLVGLAVACSEEPELDSRIVTEQIETALTDSYGLDVRVRTCPSKIPAAREETFRCTVEVDGQPLEVKVIQRDDSGDLSVEPLMAVVRTNRIADDLARTLNDRFGRGFFVQCGDPVTMVVEPGARLQCRATDGGSRRDVEVTVTDLSGSLAYDVGDPDDAPDADSPTTPIPAPTGPAPLPETLVPAPNPTGLPP